MTKVAKGKEGPGERQSLYFPKEMLDEIKDEALGQDRSLSWIIQQAWRIARLRVSAKGKATLLDSWIDQKGWQNDNPQIDEILGEGKRKG
jgi:uncharacterized small protein (TIGR04563 family)